MVEPITTAFPGLRDSDFHVTSPPTRAYNCIAWAVGDATRWWWPDPDADNDAIYWPPGVVKEETLDAFVAAFASVGFVHCVGDMTEPGFEKIALLAINELPTHAARQLPTGRWTSKLGPCDDIEHDLQALTGDVYGHVVLLMKRALPRNP